jgi:hypothetical protein
MLTFSAIVGIVVLSASVLALIIGVLLIVFGDKSYGDAAFGGVVTVACALLFGFLAQCGFMTVGYSGDYMAYKPISGQVQDIASRQIATGSSMSTRYVLQINGQPYGVDDTRAALVKKGDAVNLNCVKEFVWGSTNNGYACNWG